MSAPERVYLLQPVAMAHRAQQVMGGDIEYVRADIYAAALAVNEALRAPMSDETLSQLRAQEKELAEKLAEVQGEIKRLEIEAASRKYGVTVGDFVRRDGNIFRVTSIRPWGIGKPWLQGLKQLKSGRFSQYATSLYGEWEVIDAHQ